RGCPTMTPRGDVPRPRGLPGASWPDWNVLTDTFAVSRPRLTPTPTLSLNTPGLEIGGGRYGLRRRSQAAVVRGDHAAGCLVGAAVGDVPRLLRLHRLYHLGGVPGRALPVRRLSLAALLARDLRRRRAQLVRRQAGLVAG